MVAPAFASASSSYNVEDCGGLGNTAALNYFASSMGFAESTTGCGGGSTGLGLSPDLTTTNMAFGNEAAWEFDAPAGETISGLGTLSGSYHSTNGWLAGWALNGLMGQDPLPAAQDCTAQSPLQSCSAHSSGWVPVSNGSSVELTIACDASSTQTNTYCSNDTSQVGANVGTVVVGLTDPSDPAISASGKLWDTANGSGLTDGWVSGIVAGSSLGLDFYASNPAGICGLEAALTNSSGAIVSSSIARMVTPPTDPTIGAALGTSAPFGSSLPCGPASTTTRTFAPDLSVLPTGVYYLNVEATDPGQYQSGRSTLAVGASLADGYPIAVDNSVPTVSISTGTTDGDWYTGPRTVTVTAHDAAGSSGLKSLTCAAQGATKTYAMSGDSGSISISLSAEGEDNVDCYATSVVGNVSLAASATVNIDNQVPRLSLSNGPSTVSWYRTTQQVHASATAIGGSAMRAIDCAVGSSSRTYPATGSSTGESVQVPVSAPGGDLVCQAVDSAGNRSPKATWTFRIDDTPPTGVFDPRNPADPAQLAVHVTDTGSGVHSVQIQIHTIDGWRSLSTSLNLSTGVATALVPGDGSIPNGPHPVRALVQDVAGNSAYVTTDRSNSVAAVSLPLRRLTRLRVKVIAGHRHVVAAAAGRPHVLKLHHGARVRLAGVLTTHDGVPVKNSEIVITQHVPGRSGVRTIGHSTTNAAGHFSFKVRSGPSRTLTLRYPGTPQLRGATARTTVRVKGLVRIHLRRVIHAGRRTTITGRVLGGYIPARGALVQLWYKVKGRHAGWEPFERAIHTRHGGGFRIRFRVPGAARHLTYRFKAVVAAQVGWPFMATASRVKARRFR